MGNSQVPYFAVEAKDGSVIQVTLVNAGFKQSVLAEYLTSGRILPGAPVVDYPDLPTTPSHRWRIRNGKVVDDPTVPDPPHPRQDVLDQIDAATTIAQLKAVVRKVVTGR